MQNIESIKAIIRDNKKILSDKYFVSKIGVFGSYSRGQATSNSDIDIIVDINKPIGFFQFLEMEELLSKVLNNKVDLVSSKALKPIIGEHIKKEVQYI